MLLYITLIPYGAIIGIHTEYTFTILFANISFQCYCLKNLFDLAGFESVWN